MRHARPEALVEGPPGLQDIDRREDHRARRDLSRRERGREREERRDRLSPPAREHDERRGAPEDERDRDERRESGLPGRKPPRHRNERSRSRQEKDRDDRDPAPHGPESGTPAGRRLPLRLHGERRHENRRERIRDEKVLPLLRLRGRQEDEAHGRDRRRKREIGPRSQQPGASQHDGSRQGEGRPRKEVAPHALEIEPPRLNVIEGFEEAVPVLVDDEVVRVLRPARARGKEIPGNDEEEEDEDASNWLKIPKQAR